MTRRILVPLDGSPEAETILAHVRRIASRRDEVHLLHLVPALHAPVGPTHLLALHEQASKFLEVTRAQGLPDLEGLDFVRTGDPAEGILTLALEKNIDLIAMSTHGRSGLANLFLGSVALAVVRTSQLPVLLARPDVPSTRAIRKILLSVEGGEAPKDLLETVKSLSSGPTAEIILFHAVPRVPDPAPQWAYPTHLSPLTGPEHRLQALADSLEEQGYVAWPVVSAGEAASEILATADKQAVDLIAIATHGRSGFGRLLEGSVAETVLRKSPVPVLLQKPLVVHNPAVLGGSHAQTRPGP